MTRKKLPPRRDHINQSVTIGGKVRLYVGVDSVQPKELWLRVKGEGITSLIVAFCDQLAISTASRLQRGETLEEICEPWVGIKVEPCGPVKGDERIKMCSSILDYLGRYLLVHYGGRDDLAHVPKPEKAL